MQWKCLNIIVAIKECPELEFELDYWHKEAGLDIQAQGSNSDNTEYK